MADLHQTVSKIIQEKELIINPFSDLTYGNFWREKESIDTVESIHQDAIIKVKQQLKLLEKDPLNLTKTILITGDSGCGKSNLLGRLKKSLNQDAFFAYIQPLEDYRYFWRHTLQYTIASLMEVPEGKAESQLTLWLKSLAIFKTPDLLEQIIGEKRSFIRNLKASYPSGIYEGRKFFGILYELATDNYDLAVEWLAGEDLDEDELKTLGVTKSIDSEKLARGILTNFGRIAEATKPIILCFDQIERAFSAMFNFNTTLHNDRVINFLVLITATRDNWQEYKQGMIQSDLARINQTIILDDITSEEAEQLWQNRLRPLHQQCNPQPASKIAPLERTDLEKNAPGDRINLRVALNLGGILFQKFLDSLDSIVLPPKKMADFLTVWRQTYQKIEIEITSCTQYSDAEFREMLNYALTVLQVENINLKFLPSTNANAVNSLTYECHIEKKKTGIIWNNNSNANSFCSLMKIYEYLIDKNIVDRLFLIRNKGVGSPPNKGFAIYKSIFTPASQNNIHYKPTVEDICYLRTLYLLIKDSHSGDLIIDNKVINYHQLKSFVIEYETLNNCLLFKKLNVVTFSPKISILKQKITEIIQNQSSIVMRDLKQEIDDVYSNYFIPQYYFRQVMKSVVNGNAKINISNKDEHPENHILNFTP